MHRHIGHIGQAQYKKGAVSVNILGYQFHNFYSLETVYSHCVKCVTVKAPRECHSVVVYWALSRCFGQPLCEFYATV